MNRPAYKQLYSHLLSFLGAKTHEEAASEIARLQVLAGVIGAAGGEMRICDDDSGESANV